MTNDLADEILICRATSGDVLSILDWSEKELSEDHDEIRRVRKVLQVAFELRNDLWVCRVNGEAVGYQIGEYTAGYLAVREGLHSKKIGT